MTITLASEAFAPPVDHTLIISIFRYAVDGRHRVLADLGSTLVSTWLEMQSPPVQEEIIFAVDWSAQSEAFEPSASRVTVGAYKQNNWTDGRYLVDASWNGRKSRLRRHPRHRRPYPRPLPTPTRPRQPQLIEVDWQPPSLPPAPDCAIVLRNGRRIELSAACLAQLAGPGDLLQTLLSAADPH